MDDEQIEAVSVGKPPPQYQEIVIAEYDPEWPHWFEQAAERIRAALGDNVLRLDHCRSTAAAALPAQPLSRANLGVAGPTRGDWYAPPLTADRSALQRR